MKIIIFATLSLLLCFIYLKKVDVEAENKELVAVNDSITISNDSLTSLVKELEGELIDRDVKELYRQINGE